MDSEEVTSERPRSLVPEKLTNFVLATVIIVITVITLY